MTSILSLSEAVAELIHDGDQVACEGFTFFGIAGTAPLAVNDGAILFRVRWSIIEAAEATRGCIYQMALIGLSYPYEPDY